MFAQVFWGPLNPRWRELKDITPLEGVSAALLIASIVIMGVLWSPFTDRVGHTVMNLPGVTS